MRLRPVVLGAMVLSSAVALSAQSLQPSTENGRIVWTNDTPVQKTPIAPSVAPTTTAVTEAPKRAHYYYYWSNAEQRYKVLRSATPRAVRSARVVAGEVSSYIEGRKLDSAKPKNADGDHSASAAGNRNVSSAEIDRYINEAAARHHVDPNLVRALVKVESNFNPRALSNKGAMGLMQLMPATARMYDVRNPFDAAQNVDAGVRHLKGLLLNFRGDVSLSLAAYNAGQGAVERNGGIPPYTETRNYVKRITTLMGGGTEVRYSSLQIPVRITRDERGKLFISNTD